MENLNQEMVKLFVNNGWELEIDTDYLPEGHFDENNKNYQKFTGGRLSFYKKQKYEGEYSNGTLVEVFPKIDGYGVDFIIEDSAEGIDFNYEEIQEILETAEETYKEHTEILEEINQ